MKSQYEQRPGICHLQHQMDYTKEEGSYARVIKIHEIKFVLVTVPERSLDRSLYYKEGSEKVETSKDWKQGTACVLRL